METHCAAAVLHLLSNAVIGRHLKLGTNAYKRTIGRASREEEDPQGSREEENNIHSTIRQCHIDRWQEKGMDYQDIIDHDQALTFSI
jgi:hypothetical protein